MRSRLEGGEPSMTRIRGGGWGEEIVGYVGC